MVDHATAAITNRSVDDVSLLILLLLLPYLHCVQMYPVWCDGRFLGYVPIEKSALIERELRISKTRAHGRAVPSVAEVFYEEVRGW